MPIEPTALPTNRSVDSTPLEHVDDHKTLAKAVNYLTNNYVSPADVQAAVNSLVTPDGSITQAKLDPTLAANLVYLEDLAPLQGPRTPTDGSVTAAKLSPSLALDLVYVDDLADITTGVADASITQAKLHPTLESKLVYTEDLADIDTEIADGSITMGKLDPTFVNSLVFVGDEGGGGGPSGLVDGSVTEVKLEPTFAGTLVRTADGRLTDQRAPTDASVTEVKLEPTFAGTLVRTADGRLTDQRVPTDASVTEVKLEPTFAGTLVRTADSRLTNQRVPTDASVTEAKLASDLLSTLVRTTNLNTPNNPPTLDSNGTLANSVFPPLAISDTFPVTNQAEMLALTAQPGDVAIRSDVSRSFILKTSPATTLANWRELLTPGDAITSVDGRVGVVSLTDLYVGAADARLTNTRTPTDGTVTVAKTTLTGGSNGMYLTKQDGAPGGWAWDTVVNAASTALAANGKGFMNHGATAGTARPTGFASIEWHGSVEPTNATDNDTWVVTT